MQKSWLPYEWLDTPRKVELPQAARLPRVVFKAEGMLCSEALRVQRMLEDFQRKGDSNLRGLAALL